MAVGQRKLTAHGAKSDRQVRRHKSAVRTIIENQAGPDETKQIALAESVLDDLRGKSDAATHKHRTCDLKGLDVKSKSDSLAVQFIMQSLKHSIAVIKDRVKGRPTTADRRTMQTIVSAATKQVPLHAGTSRFLNVDRRHFSTFRDLWANFEVGDAPTPCIAKEMSGALPCNREYADFVLSQCNIFNQAGHAGAAA